MKEEIYTHNSLELGRMPDHNRPHGEAPGCVRRQKEWEENGAITFIVVFTGKNGKVNKLSRFRIG